MIERIVIDLPRWTLYHDASAGLSYAWHSKNGAYGGTAFEAGFKDETTAKIWARAKGIIR